MCQAGNIQRLRHVGKVESWQRSSEGTIECSSKYFFLKSKYRSVSSLCVCVCMRVRVYARARVLVVRGQASPLFQNYLVCLFPPLSVFVFFGCFFLGGGIVVAAVFLFFSGKEGVTTAFVPTNASLLACIRRIRPSHASA